MTDSVNLCWYYSDSERVTCGWYYTDTVILCLILQWLIALHFGWHYPGWQHYLVLDTTLTERVTRCSHYTNTVTLCRTLHCLAELTFVLTLHWLTERVTRGSHHTYAVILFLTLQWLIALACADITLTRELPVADTTLILLSCAWHCNDW
jgi:hypothetical protein